MGKRLKLLEIDSFDVVRMQFILDKFYKKDSHLYPLEKICRRLIKSMVIYHNSHKSKLWYMDLHKRYSTVEDNVDYSSAIFMSYYMNENWFITRDPKTTIKYMVIIILKNCYKTNGRSLMPLYYGIEFNKFYSYLIDKYDPKFRDTWTKN